MQTKNTSFFAQPKFIVGLRALEHIPTELDGYNAKRAMVITNRQNKKLFGKHLISALADSNVTVSALFDDVNDYVIASEINRLKGLFHYRECDSIIALGGKAVLDFAKAIRSVISEGSSNKYNAVISPQVPLVYAATPYLNGLEVTPTLNIDGKVYISEIYYPDIICIDDRLSRAVSLKKDLVNAAFYSLVRCIEGASNEPNNSFVDASALTAVQLIAENLPVFIDKPNNRKATLAIINGIAVAGTVQSNSQGGMASLSAQIISRETELPLGMICGILLPFPILFKQMNSVAIREDLLLALVGIDKFCNTPRENRAELAIEKLEIIKELASQYIPSNLRAINLQEHKLEKIASEVEVLSHSKILKANCVDFLRSAYTNKP